MLMDDLRNQSAFWSKLGFCYNPPRFGKDGRLITFYDRESCIRYHRQMYDAGIRFHSSLLFSGWVADGVYDYTETDRTLEAVFSCGPDLRYLPRIKLDVPLDWGKNHPEDLLVYYDGPRDAESIRALVDTPRHDILGYDADGVFVPGFKDDRINRGGLISNQSFASEQWKQDASETLRRLIRHIEDGPWGDRIAGYHISYGICGETCMWGGFLGSCHYGDYGIRTREAFFDWGMREYESLEALRRVWNAPDLTRGNIEPPAPEIREGLTEDPERFFRQASEDRICIDYEKFINDRNADALETFGKVAKESSGGKPVGAFYGYYMNLPRSGCNGHLAYERILNSPYIDFIAAPAGYFRRGPGEPGGEQVCAQSINRKKLFLDELDNRTPLSADSIGRADTMESAASVLWREFCKNMMYGSNFWWMDLGGGWFDSPELLAVIRKTEETAHRLRRRHGQSIAEVLLVSDENAFYRMRPNGDLHTDLLKHTVAEFLLCGTPVDHYRFSDLSSLDLTRYKVIVFLNGIQVDVSKIRISEKTALMYFYASSPDFLDSYVPNSDSVNLFFPDGEEKILRREHCYPWFRIREGSGVAPLVRTSDGAVILGEIRRDGRREFVCPLPVLKVNLLRMMLERCGVSFYAPEGCVVYGDSRFLGVFAGKGIALDDVEGVETVAESSAESEYAFRVKITW